MEHIRQGPGKPLLTSTFSEVVFDLSEKSDLEKVNIGYVDNSHIESILLAGYDNNLHPLRAVRLTQVERWGLFVAIFLF